MTWHTETVPRDALASFLAVIRRAGGTIMSSRPAADGICVTWTSG